jgi:hypothetical protein
MRTAIAIGGPMAFPYLMQPPFQAEISTNLGVRRYSGKTAQHDCLGQIFRYIMATSHRP